MRLSATIGPVELIFYSVGVIVGAGVYSVIGAAAGLADQSLWLSFIIGAAVAALTAVSYAEMTTAFPAAGAEYVYIRYALPNLGVISYSVAIVILLGGGAAAATVAVAFGGYVRIFADIPQPISAMMLLAACTLVIAWGLREASWVNMLFTSIEVAGLFLVIAAGLTRDNFGESLFVMPAPGTLAASAILFFVYLGFEEVANLTEEVRRPSRDLPLAIFVSLAITAILYILVALAAVALVSPRELAESEAPLAIALDRAWPHSAGLLSAIALFATANTVLVTLIAASRLAFSMARDGELPNLFASVLPRRGTPAPAVILVTVIAVVLLPMGDIRILAELSSFAALVAFLAVNLTLIVLRYRLPDHPRPFRVPLAIGRMPLLPLAAITSIFVLLAQFDTQILVAGAIAIAVAMAAYFLRRSLLGVANPDPPPPGGRS